MALTLIICLQADIGIWYSIILGRYHNYLKKKNKDEENDNDIIDCLGHNNNNPSELIFETITEDRGTVSRFSDNIIFDSGRGDEYAKYDPQKKEWRYERYCSTYRAFAEGSFVFLEPLPIGKHVVNLKVSVLNPIEPSYNYDADYTYHLNIVPSNSTGASTPWMWKILSEETILENNILFESTLDT